MVDANGCFDEVTPHRGSANPVNGEFYFAERFAIDWVRLDEESGCTPATRPRWRATPIAALRCMRWLTE